MRSPLRVLHVIPSLAREDGGPTRALLEMEAGLAEAGAEVTTLTTISARDGRPAEPLGGVRRLHFRRWTTAYKVAPGLLLALPGLLRRHDIVHVHALFSFAPNVVALAARAFGVPYIVRPLGTLSRYGLLQRRPGLKRLSLALIEGAVLRGASAVHFTSAAEQEEAERLAIAFKGVVIPLGVSLPAPVAEPFFHPAMSDRVALLFLSRLDPKKNLEGLVDALGRSRRFAASAVLLIAGDGPADYVAELKARVARAGLDDRVVWLGHVDGERKAALFAAADVFVLPSLSENFGIAAVEALAAGLPCVLGRGVAVADEVAGAGAGIVVAPDPADLRAAIDALLDDPAARTAMGRRARALAGARFSPAAMTGQLMTLYERISAPGTEQSR